MVSLTSLFARRTGTLLFLFLLTWVCPAFLAAQAERAEKDSTKLATERAKLERYYELDARMEEYRKLRREYNRLRTYTGWEGFASYNTFFGAENFYGSGVGYLRADGPGEDTREYPLYNGETVYANANDYFYQQTDATSAYHFFRLGLARQSTWGGRVRLAFGYASLSEMPKAESLADIPTNALQFLSTTSEQMVTSELGFEYTFFRSRRVRPYLSFNLLAFLFYEGSIRQEVYDGETGERGLIRGFYSKEYFPVYLDFAIEFGLQVQVTPRLSLGPHLWANGGGNIYVLAPFGLEARYRLGKVLPLRRQKIADRFRNY